MSLADIDKMSVNFHTRLFVLKKEKYAIIKVLRRRRGHDRNQSIGAISVYCEK